MEYEFRGKRVDNGDWVYGNLDKNKEHSYITRWEGIAYYSPEVMTASVGQFTGMYDNTTWEDLTIQEQNAWIYVGNAYDDWKGKKVYEGDIIPYHFNDNILGVVTYGEYKNTSDDKFNKHVGFYMKWNTENAELNFRKDLGYWLSTSKVVGNIYDRKENENVSTSNRAQENVEG